MANGLSLSQLYHAVPVRKQQRFHACRVRTRWLAEGNPENRTEHTATGLKPTDQEHPALE